MQRKCSLEMTMYYSTSEHSYNSDDHKSTIWRLFY